MDKIFKSASKLALLILIQTLAISLGLIVYYNVKSEVVVTGVIETFKVVVVACTTYYFTRRADLPGEKNA